MRLSPDGRHVLYSRPRGKRHELVLRELTTKKDSVLPVKPLESDMLNVFMRRCSAFDPSGNKMVLLDYSRGMFRQRTEVVLFDISSGKLVKTAISDQGAMATFDRTGESLIVLKGPPDEPRLYRAPLSDFKLKPLKVLGSPVSVCPSEDVICLRAPGKSKDVHRDRITGQDDHGGQRLFLYDMEAETRVADLAVHHRHYNANDWEAPWTPDGRYLCYYDSLEKTGSSATETHKTESGDKPDSTKDECPPPELQVRPGKVTRVWDRQAGKETGIVEDAIPLGSGPTATTVILCRPHSSNSVRFGEFLLYDVHRGIEWSLGKARVWPMDGRGRFVLYGQPTSKSQSALPGQQEVLFGEIAVDANKKKQ
jgi:hypothetical protein